MYRFDGLSSREVIDQVDTGLLGQETASFSVRPHFQPTVPLFGRGVLMVELTGMNERAVPGAAPAESRGRVKPADQRPDRPSTIPSVPTTRSTSTIPCFIAV
jgi:hypothetical protein